MESVTRIKQLAPAETVRANQSAKQPTTNAQPQAEAQSPLPKLLKRWVLENLKNWKRRSDFDENSSSITKAKKKNQCQKTGQEKGIGKRCSKKSGNPIA